jgi:hypothetical protein
MTWTRLGDDFTDRPDVIGLSDAAFRAHVEALVWSNQQTTDGRLPGGVRELRRILSIEDVAAAVTELTKAGLWEPAGDDYQLDWSEQESAERFHERKAFNAARQANYRDRSERHARGDHTACDPRFCKATNNALRNASSNASVTATRPVPSRPPGRDRDSGAVDATDRSAGATRPSASRARKKSASARSGDAPRAPRQEVEPRAAYREPLELLLTALRLNDHAVQQIVLEQNGHEWRDDGSGLSCDTCGLHQKHLFHLRATS